MPLHASAQKLACALACSRARQGRRKEGRVERSRTSTNRCRRTRDRTPALSRPRSPFFHRKPPPLPKRTVKHLREASQLLDAKDGHACLFHGGSAATGRDNLISELVQTLRGRAAAALNLDRSTGAVSRQERQATPERPRSHSPAHSPPICPERARAAHSARPTPRSRASGTHLSKLGKASLVGQRNENAALLGGSGRSRSGPGGRSLGGRGGRRHAAQEGGRGARGDAACGKAGSGFELYACREGATEPFGRGSIETHRAGTAEQEAERDATAATAERERERGTVTRDAPRVVFEPRDAIVRSEIARNRCLGGARPLRRRNCTATPTPHPHPPRLSPPRARHAPSGGGEGWVEGRERASGNRGRTARATEKRRGKRGRQNSSELALFALPNTHQTTRLQAAIAHHSAMERSQGDRAADRHDRRSLAKTLMNEALFVETSKRDA